MVISHRSKKRICVSTVRCLRFECFDNDLAYKRRFGTRVRLQTV